MDYTPSSDLSEVGEECSLYDPFAVAGVAASTSPIDDGFIPRLQWPDRLPSASGGGVFHLGGVLSGIQHLIKPAELPTPFGNTGSTHTKTQLRDKSGGVENLDSEGLIQVNNSPIICRLETGYFVDWLGFTVFERYGDYRDVMSWLTPSGKEGDWYEIPGKHGYRKGMRRGSLILYYDGSSNMGAAHVSLSGGACRQLEEEFGCVSESDWIRWLVALRFADGVNISRLDIAKDDKSGLLDLSVIREKTREGHTVSSFRTWNRRSEEGGSLGDKFECLPSGESETIYYGKRSSEMYVKIYNKQAERYEVGEEGAESGHWVRVEATFKDKKADNLLFLLSQVPSFDVVGAWVQQALSFREPSDNDTNKSRWEPCAWWGAFFDHVSKLPRAVGKKAEKTLEQVKGWVKRQVSQSLAVVCDVIYSQSRKSGLSPTVEIRKYIVSLLEEGRGRYRSKHLALLADCQSRLNIVIPEVGMKGVLPL